MSARYLEHRLKLSALRLADALETHRSLLKASAALGLSQPALTKSLQELEDQLQTRLFDRHARGVRPTEAGLVFVTAARRILAEVRYLDDELDVLSSPDGGILSIGALPVAAGGVLPGVLRRLRADHPRMKLRLREGRMEELLPLLASGEIDLVVGRLYEPEIPDSFVREALWREPISVLARPGHPVFEGETTAQTLARHDLVLPTITQRVGREIDHALALLGFDPVRALRASSYGLIREMLLGADMVAIMPSFLMLGDLERGVLHMAPLPVAAPDRPAGLVQRKDGPRSMTANVFIEALRIYAAEFSRRGWKL